MSVVNCGRCGCKYDNNATMCPMSSCSGNGRSIPKRIRKLEQERKPGWKPVVLNGGRK